jgi:cyclophilin family peptidyl-prolyl cis-trans isomerase
MGARASFHPHRRFPGSARRTLRRVYHALRHLHDRTFFRPRTAYVRQLSQPRQRHPGSKERKTFYTGLTWYRVVPGFVIQSGNPGLRDTDDLPAPVTPHFPDEFAPGLGHDASGILSMANAGPDTSSCEFFLTLAPTPRLNYLHAVLGRTVRGLEILPQIRQDDDASIKIIRVGPAAEAFHVIPAAFTAAAATAKAFTASSTPGARYTRRSGQPACEALRSYAVNCYHPSTSNRREGWPARRVDRLSPSVHFTSAKSLTASCAPTTRKRC